MAKRASEWIDTFITFQLVDGGQTNLFLDQGRTQQELRGCTIDRILIHLQAAPTEQQVEGITRLALGIGLVSRESFTAGSLPDANENTDKPLGGWMWRDSLMVAESDQILTESGVRVITEIRADIRSGRKFGEGRCYLSAHNILVASSAVTVQVAGLIRLHCLLP